MAIVFAVVVAYDLARGLLAPALFPTSPTPLTHLQHSTFAAMTKQSTKNPFSDEARILDHSPPTPKRLIVCCDGTWKASDHASKGDSSYQTNITRMCHALADDGVLPDGERIPQIVYYQDGLGTNIPTAFAREVLGVWILPLVE